MLPAPSSFTCLPQQFLLQGGTLDELEASFHVSHKRHGKYPNLVQLKYSQIDSPLGDKLVQECRGIILDQDDKWRVVAWPFRKFFNQGEPHAATIDWKTARVHEKLDGSLMVLYWYDGEWQVATTGMPDAAGMVHGTNKLFMQLFWETWYKLRWELPGGINHGYTFMFELTSPYNRVVVRYPEAKLHLVGMKSVWMGTEVPIRYRTIYNPAREWALNNLDSVLATFESMSPLEQEGYVIVDDAFNRVKVKHPGYVALHHLRSSFSVRRLVEMVRRGETDELLVHFPEWKDTILGVKAAYDGLVVQLEQDYREIAGITERRDFAMMANQSVWPAAHYLLRDGKATTVKAALQNVHVDRMLGLLGVENLRVEAPI